MSTLIRIHYRKTSGGSHPSDKVIHFEGRYDTPSAKPDEARTVAAEWLSKEWLEHELAKANHRHGGTGFSVVGISQTDLRSGHTEALEFMQPVLPWFRQYAPVDVHFVVFEVGGQEYFTDEDLLALAIDAWGCRFHAVVTVPGNEYHLGDPLHWSSDFTEPFWRDGQNLPHVPFADVFALNGDNTRRATSWMWSVGDTWTAVVGDTERDSWWADEIDKTGAPEVWERPINDPPATGTLRWLNHEGDEQEMAATDRVIW